MCFAASEPARIEAAPAEADQDDTLKLPTLQMTSSPSARKEKPTTDFDICMACARKHRVSVSEVKKCYDEFVKLDVNKDGCLKPDEFEVVVRKVCGVEPDAPTPSHLFERQWRMLDPHNRGYVGFDDFFTWFRNVAFCPDISTPCDVDVTIRKMSKRYGFNILDLERVCNVYSKYAEGGGTGCIDKSKFKQILCRVIGIPMDADVPEDTLRRYFREMDVNGDGEVDFEEFAKWYLSVHTSDG